MLKIGDAAVIEALHLSFDEYFSTCLQYLQSIIRVVLRGRLPTLLSSSMAEHPAVNRRVVGSSPT